MAVGIFARLMCLRGAAGDVVERRKYDVQQLVWL